MSSRQTAIPPPRRIPATSLRAAGRNPRTTETSRTSFSIVAVDRFIHATRDSGYKGTPSAVAELVDNALQAGAHRVKIKVSHVSSGDDSAIELVVVDDGTGMPPQVLRNALRFGGSTRFNDRRGLGRYGMGLPNSSMSQARRVTVYTWQSGTPVFQTHLDLDEIASGAMTTVPAPRKSKFPFDGEFGKTGTIVVWSRCDRLDNRRVSTLCRKLLSALGRQFRYFLWGGVTITVNDDPVEPIDPLFVEPGAKYRGAELFGEPLEYEVQASPGNGAETIGRVRVRFSELPVSEWHALSNKEKRTLGISKGAGVSIVRAGREVDYGWFFLGGKRRENYDDWWRCEVQFDPILDEVFGITHTKQQIRPKADLLEALSPDIEATGHALNGRARKAHLAARVAERFSESEQLASAREHMLAPIPDGSRDRDIPVLKDLKSRLPALRTGTLSARAQRTSADGRLEYKIVEAAVMDLSFFAYAREPGRLLLAINPGHPFYKLVYKPLADSSAPRDRVLRTQIELLVLALARAEAEEEDRDALKCMERVRLAWSNNLATFLNG